MDRPGVVDREPDPRYEPVDAPDAPTFPVPEPYDDDERGYEPIRPRSGLGELLRKLGAPFVGLGLLILKFGGLLLKFKVVTTGASMLVSIGVYAWIWGLPFAIGFVLLIFVHELGHVLELRRQGVPASAPLFIPFLGAVIGMKAAPRRRVEGGAGRARRADSRLRRRCGVLDRGRGDGVGAAWSPSRSSASSSTSSISSRSSRSTAAGLPERCTPRSGSSASS